VEKSAEKERRREGVNRGVGTENKVLTEVWSGGNRGMSGSGSSQTLAEQDVEMGGVEVRGGESEGAAGGTADVSENAT
jgi:hypothetical protein